LLLFLICLHHQWSLVTRFIFCSNGSMEILFMVIGVVPNILLLLLLLQSMYDEDDDNSFCLFEDEIATRSTDIATLESGI
jgi:hypothetical protein